MATGAAADSKSTVDQRRKPSGDSEWEDVPLAEVPRDLQGAVLPQIGTQGGRPVFQGKPARQPDAIDRFLAPDNETADPKKYDPNTLKGYAARWAQAGKGGAASIRGLFSLDSLPGTDTNPVIWNPIKQLEKDWQGVKDWNELRKVNPDYAWAGMFAPMLFTHTLARFLEPAGMTAKLARGTGVDSQYIEPVVADLRRAVVNRNQGSFLARTGKKVASGVRSMGQQFNPNAPYTIRDFIKLASEAQKPLDNEVDALLARYGNQRSNLPNVNGQFPLSDAIIKLKDKVPNITAADRAEQTWLNNAAAEYQKPISYRELDLKRKQANARLDAYYNKNDVTQYAAETKNAQIAVDKAVADWVRDNVYAEWDRLANRPPGYFRNLKTRVGNLMNVQSQANDFADRVHNESMVERGTTRMGRLRPGASISSKGTPHGFVSNITSALKAPDPEGAANAAVKSAFKWYQSVPPLTQGDPLTMPAAALLSWLRTDQKLRDQQQLPSLPELKTEAQEKRPAAPKNYAHVFAGPGGHQIGSNDGVQWFDVQTGQPIENK